MHPNATAAPDKPIHYPESDGKPIADGPRQFQWVVLLYSNLRALFGDRPDVFVGCNQFWYPLEGHPEIVETPDPYVVFGRPKGDRGCYKQWEEGHVPLTVIFEIPSPQKGWIEMADKHAFYEEHGVEEYYICETEGNRLLVYLRRGPHLRRVHRVNGFVSPRLGIRFDLSGPELVVYEPDGEPFLTFEESHARYLKALQQVEQAEQARQRTDQLRQRTARMQELIRRFLAGQATAEERDELNRLVQPPAASP